MTLEQQSPAYNGGHILGFVFRLSILGSLRCDPKPLSSRG